MTKFERASQLWAILALAATNRQVLIYELVSRLTGIPRPAIGGFLDPIQTYCQDKQIPPLTSIVASEKTEFGQKYEVRGVITGPQNRPVELVTVWIVLSGEEVPRFITAYPGDE